MNEKKHVFIIGSKGIPAQYGGFETFVHKLAENQTNKTIQYHVACISDKTEEYILYDSRCFRVNTPDVGNAKAILYDLKSLKLSLEYIDTNKLKDTVIYILGCRIGPFLWWFRHKINKLGVNIYINPDGHEWKRDKWNIVIKKYWKYSEKLMTQNANMVICDCKAMQRYIQKEYKRYKPDTACIAYGANIKKSIIAENDKDLINWYSEKGLEKEKYYLMVGRFVPENNYETVIKEFLRSKTDKNLAIITNFEKNYYYKKLSKNTNFENDPRIKFVGVMYNRELLKKIRENAFAYIHGHEVGGTNPSLLEALASTNLNIVLNVAFNREVCGNSAIFFSKAEKKLSDIIDSTEQLDQDEILKYGWRAKKRIYKNYSWKKIVSDYEKLFSVQLPDQSQNAES